MKKVKSVAFNLYDPYESRLYDHAKQHKVFSAYVKRLIQRDMEEKKLNNRHVQSTKRTETKGIRLDLR